MVLFGLPHAGERVSFIPSPRSFYSKQGFNSEHVFPRSINTNNPLAVEPESEKDVACEILPSTSGGGCSNAKDLCK
jgi:hypothetical protein